MPAHIFGRPGALREPGVPGLADVRLQLGLGTRELVFVVDPDQPAVGLLVKPGLHSQREEVIAEELRIEVPWQRADLTQRSFPWRLSSVGKAPGLDGRAASTSARRKHLIKNNTRCTPVHPPSSRALHDKPVTLDTQGSTYLRQMSETRVSVGHP